MARVGRYKFNKRLRLGARIVGLKSADDIISAVGEILARAGDVINKSQAEDIQNAGINEFYTEINGVRHKIIGNNSVSFKSAFGKDPRVFGLLDYVYYPMVKFSALVNDTAAERARKRPRNCFAKK